VVKIPKIFSLFFIFGQAPLGQAPLTAAPYIGGGFIMALNKEKSHGDTGAQSE